MKLLDFIRTLEAYEKPVFTVNDVSKVIDADKKYARVYLNRLKAKDVVEAVERDKYVLAGTHPYVAATNLVFPSYMSFLTALHYYGATTQIPRIIYIASTRSKKSLTIRGYTLDFIKLKKERFFGYTRERFQGKFIFVAEKEKLIVDSLFLPRYCPIDEIYNAMGDEKLSIDTLVEYGLKMDSVVTIKRLGYLLEKKGIDIYERLKPGLNKKYDLLNPLLPKKGEKDIKWRLVINEMFSDAK
jgi:predicted transcriptional regulator of viral defense system